MRFTAPVTPIVDTVQTLLVSGDANALQEITGGWAGRDSGSKAVGLQAEHAASLAARHNWIRGGAAPDGTLQIGMSVAHASGESEVEGNLIEACGLVDALGVLHHSGCDDLQGRSVGLFVSDNIGDPTFVFNNRVFGGFSGAGTSSLQVADSGGGRVQVVVFNNLLNAQGPWATDCSGATVPDARAIELLPAPSGTGAGLEFHNNLIDGGGRTCLRYGVYERDTWPAATFDDAVFGHNIWVQELAGRDNMISGAAAWGYRELDGTLWCLAGVDTIAPGQCLNNPTAPTTASYFASNLEGDPAFVGNDTEISERPGTLSLTDFRTTAALVDGAGTMSLPLTLDRDFEGDPRSGGTCDIGHDETP